jgi:hypothetical protein
MFRRALTGHHPSFRAMNPHIQVSLFHQIFNASYKEKDSANNQNKRRFMQFSKIIQISGV